MKESSINTAIICGAVLLLWVGLSTIDSINKGRETQALMFRQQRNFYLCQGKTPKECMDLLSVFN